MQRATTTLFHVYYIGITAGIDQPIAEFLGFICLPSNIKREVHHPCGGCSSYLWAYNARRDQLKRHWL
jgi:hypothetical protein